MQPTKLFYLLKKLQIPVAYDHFDDRCKVTPPFLAYREKAPNTFKADNKNYYSTCNYEIELVTEKKDFELENKIANLLTEYNISFDKLDDDWDENERIYHIFFEI